MTWTNRTEGGRARSILVDEYSQDWRIDASGHLAWDSTSVSQVYDAVMTMLASVPSNPTYGSRLHDGWKLGGTMPQELEASILSALEPLVVAGIVKRGTARVEIEQAGPYIAKVSIQWTDGGGQKQDLAIPIQPGFGS